MRKSLFLILALWLSAIAGLHAQLVLLGVWGQVTTPAGAAVPNQTVTFVSNSLIWPVLGSTTTTANGYYMDSLLVTPVMGTVGQIYAITIDSCTGITHMDTITFTPNGAVFGVPANFTVCNSTTTSCGVSLSTTPSPTSPMTFTFTANASVSSPNNIGYSWNFGDGTVLNVGPTTSSSNTQTHTYASPGQYSPFVTVYDSIFCTAVAYDTVLAVPSGQYMSVLVHGTVTDPTGAPVANQQVHFLSDTTLGGVWVYGYTWTNANGYYSDSVLVPSLTAGQTGLLGVTTIDCNSNGLMNAVTYNATGSVTSGTPSNFVICANPSYACTVQGTITDLSGNPVPNQWVSISITTPTTVTTYTDSNGHYSYTFQNMSGATGLASVYVSDCMGFWVSATAPYGPNGTSPAPINIQICSSVVTNCQASFYGLYDSTNTAISLYDYSYASSGGPMTYNWVISDGSMTFTSSQQNPIISGLSGGIVSVCLTIADATGCTSTFCDNIYPNVLPSCTANFTYTATGNTVSFTDLSTFANPAGSHSYFWDFGDGNYDTTANPVHTYAGPGIYYVYMTISDSLSGCYDYSFQAVGVGFNSACAAVFSYYGSGNTQYFYPYSFTGASPSPSATISWDFGDGNTATGYSPTHTYAQSGVYYVCMSITDSACSFSWCDSVYIGNYWGCDASFSYYEKGAYGLVDFYGNNWGWSSTETWDFGDGTTGIGGWPTHQYAANGTYNVCHFVYDSLANCADSFCTQITVSTVGVAGGCQASYFWSPDQVDTLKVYFASQYFNIFGGGATSWSWTFGDGTSSTLENPDHTYAASGTYGVCLTATDSLGCSSTYCDSVFVNTFPIGTNALFGTVFAGQQPVDYAKVYLVSLDPASLSLMAVDSTTISPADSGMYFFQNVPSNMYTVKAALDTNSSVFASYMPTYFGDSLFWLDAQWFFLPGYVPQSFDINLRAGVNTGGPGFIGGSIFAGANKNGQGMAGVDILLLDQSMNAIAHTQSDANGNFGFPGLPMGDYMVYVDMMNRTTSPAPVSLKQGAMQVNNIEIEVHSTEITFAVTTSIAPEVASQVGNVYPNPTTGLAALDLTLERAADLRVEVVSVLGTRMWSSETKLAAGKHTLPVNLEDMPAGVYMVRVLNEGSAVAIRRVVKD